MQFHVVRVQYRDAELFVTRSSVVVGVDLRDAHQHDADDTASNARAANGRRNGHRLLLLRQNVAIPVVARHCHFADNRHHVDDRRSGSAQTQRRFGSQEISFPRIGRRLFCCRFHFVGRPRRPTLPVQTMRIGSIDETQHFEGRIRL